MKNWIAFVAGVVITILCMTLMLIINTKLYAVGLLLSFAIFAGVGLWLEKTGKDEDIIKYPIQYFVGTVIGMMLFCVIGCLVLNS